MAEAWMVRESEQNKLIEDLMRMFHQATDSLIDREFRDAEEEKISSACRNFTSAIAAAMLNNDPRAVIRHDAVRNFLKAVRAEIRKFARAPQEELALSWRFFLKLVETLSREAENDLRRLEFNNPQTIFNASGAMAEVEIE